jgi:hypothetical protein
MKTYLMLLVPLFVLIFGCASPDPNSTKSGEDELKSLELDRALSKNDRKFEDVLYVPIYSDIYIDKVIQSSLLSATLSIRNTSLNDSLFVTKIDYYNTEGDLVKAFINQPIGLAPMATVNYVVEKEDTSGGPGANFIVKLNSNNKIKPLIQAVMIGENGNKGFAFSTDGYSIE